MGAHVYGRDVGRRAASLAALVALGCLALGLFGLVAASAQGYGSSAPSEVRTDPAEVIPGGAKLNGRLNPGGLPTTYYFEYLAHEAAECVEVGVENCWPHTTQAGPVTGDSQERVAPIELTGLRMGETYRYRLTASNADGTVSGGVATFTVGFSPVIASLEPNHGPTSGGTTVTIEGEPLENARSVHFGTVEGKILYEECHKECEIMPYRTLVVESPPHAPGTVDVTVETAQGASVASPGDKFTYGPSGAPSIESESASNITSTDATLQAQINTEGLETSYRFTLWPQPCSKHGVFYCELVAEPIPLPSGKLLGSFIGQSVSLDLSSAGVYLNPGEEYSYSVIATNTAGSTDGPSQTFEASSGVFEPLGATTSAEPGAGQPPASGGDQTAGSGGSWSSPAPGVGVLGTQIGKTSKPKSLTNAQKLAKALKACEKKPKGKRAACEKQAHRKYGTAAKRALG